VRHRGGQAGRRVVVIERSDRIGKKILISGGGRCLTSLNVTRKFYLGNLHFCKSALALYAMDSSRW
jgi:predicted flavoprotein YhiN